MTPSNVIGTGVDLVENERIAELLAKWGKRFADRVFLPAEQVYCDSKATPSLYYAARFAVKEAVSKAFGTGIGPSLGWLDIEVVKDAESGAPSIALGPNGRRLATEKGVHEVLISLSHTHHFAVAHALLIGPGKREAETT